MALYSHRGGGCISVTLFSPRPARDRPERPVTQNPQKPLSSELKRVRSLRDREGTTALLAQGNNSLTVLREKWDTHPMSFFGKKKKRKRNLRGEYTYYIKRRDKTTSIFQRHTHLYKHKHCTHAYHTHVHNAPTSTQTPPTHTHTHYSHIRYTEFLQ